MRDKDTKILEAVYEDVNSIESGEDRSTRDRLFKIDPGLAFQIYEVLASDPDLQEAITNKFPLASGFATYLQRNL